MDLDTSISQPIAALLSGSALPWLLTYLLHSTLLLGLAWLADRLGGLSPRGAERIWRGALLGGLLTATLQVGLQIEPWAGNLELTAPATMTTSPGGRRPFPAAEAPSAPAPQKGAPVQRTRAEVSSEETHRVPREQGHRTPIPPPNPLAGLTLLLWPVVALGLLFELALGQLRLSYRLRQSRQVGGALKHRLDALCRKAERQLRVRLSTTSSIHVPIAAGLFRPQICLPKPLLKLADDEQEAVLAHELAHLLRRDPLWLLVQAALVRTLFLQPLNLVARRRLRQLAEYHCDDWTVQATGRPLPLARSLAEVATWRAGRRLAGSAVGFAARRSELGRRIDRLLKQGETMSPPGTRQPPVSVLVAVGLLVILVAPGVSGSAPATDEGVNPEPAGSAQQAPPVAEARSTPPSVEPVPSPHAPVVTPRAQPAAPRQTRAASLPTRAAQPTRAASLPTRAAQPTRAASLPTRAASLPTRAPRATTVAAAPQPVIAPSPVVRPHPTPGRAPLPPSPAPQPLAPAPRVPTPAAIVRPRPAPVVVATPQPPPPAQAQPSHEESHPARAELAAVLAEIHALETAIEAEAAELRRAEEKRIFEDKDLARERREEAQRKAAAAASEARERSREAAARKRELSFRAERLAREGARLDQRADRLAIEEARRVAGRSRREQAGRLALGRVSERTLRAAEEIEASREELRILEAEIDELLRSWQRRMLRDRGSRPPQLKE